MDIGLSQSNYVGAFFGPKVIAKVTLAVAKFDSFVELEPIKDRPR